MLHPHGLQFVRVQAEQAQDGRSLWSAHADARFAPTAFAVDAAVFDLA